MFAPPSAADVGAPRWLISSMDEYNTLYKQSINDPDTFWANAASELHWFSPWSTVCEFDAPDARW
ncbi:MAG: acetyl-coenzyme A synthetase N-terminal domain-containing protein, partial [Planctomycetota bacterium]